MISQLNKILNSEQIEAALSMLLSGFPVKILRTIAQTGKYFQSNPWVYYECELSGKKVATFVSTKDLLDAFWNWLEKVDVLLLAFWETFAIAKAIYAQIELGDWVGHRQYGRVQVVAKDECSSGNPRLWVRYQQTSHPIDPILVAFKY